VPALTATVLSCPFIAGPGSFAKPSGLRNTGLAPSVSASDFFTLAFLVSFVYPRHSSQLNKLAISK
jgi:hypothetical protein